MMATGAEQEEVYTLLLTDIQVDSMLKEYYHDHLLRNEIGKVISVDLDESNRCAIVKIKVKAAIAAKFLEEIQGNLKQKDRSEIVHCLYSESSTITLNWNASMKNLATGMVEYAKKHYPMVDVKHVEGIQVTISGVAHDVLALQEQYNRYIANNFHSLLPQPPSTSSSSVDDTVSENNSTIKEYPNLSPDVLALLQKIPEGKIPGIQYDTKRGCVVLEGCSPEEESTCISTFQVKYHELTTARKMKIDALEIPEQLSESTIKEIVSSFDAKYSQCVFITQEDPRAIRVISNSSRQFEQAKKMLRDKFSEAVNKEVIGASSCEGMVIPIAGGRKLMLKQSDIVKEDVDIIVNAANSGLAHGAGVAGAINRASNGSVQKYSDRYTQRYGQVATGRVAYTNAGGRLKCKHIIHAVGPTKSGCSTAECEHLLYQVVENVLRCATKLDASSIAMPAISAGLFGIRKELVATCVIEGILRHKFTKPPPVLSDIRIVIIDQPTYSCFAEIFATKMAISASKSVKSLIKPATFIPPTFAEPQPSSASSDADHVMAPKSDPLPNANSSKGASSHALSVDIADTIFTRDDAVKLHSLLLPLANNNWRILGVLLGFKKETLDSLQVSSTSFLDFIQAWIDGRGGVASLSSLTEALNGSVLNKGSLAAEIVKAFTMERKDVTHTEVMAPHSVGRLLTLADDSVKLRSVLEVDHNKWNTLGILLGFTQEVLQNMASSAGGMESYLNRMIISWLSGDASQQPTLESLATALRHPKMGEEKVAAKLLEVYGLPTSHTSPTEYSSGGTRANSITYPKLSLLGGESGNAGNNTSKPKTPPPSFSPGTANSNPPVLNKSLSDPLSKPWPELISSSNTAPSSTITTTIASQTSTNTHDFKPPGGGRGFSYSLAVSSSKSGRRIAANLGSGNKTSAVEKSISSSAGVPMIGVSAKVDTEHGSTAGVVTSQPTSLSSKINDSHGHPHGTNISKGAAAAADETDAKCSICLDAFKNPTVTKCGHKFCTHCIEENLRFNSQCPICKAFLKPVSGNQPLNGTMNTVILPSVHLPGFRKCQTICITYHFPSGIQGREHPHPGQMYTGTQRTAYLPYNHEGMEVLMLLQKAFAARLTFTVGKSVTTGQDNTVIWNDIHHKTNTDGGETNYGYPDQNYLQRVKEELAAKGIFPDPPVL